MGMAEYAEEWRARARDLRRIAATMRHEITRQQLIDIAVKYERIAENAADLDSALNLGSNSPIN